MSAIQDEITLPIQVTSRAEVSRLLREVQEVDEFLEQSAIRKPGTATQLPKTSRLLEGMAVDNRLNLLLAQDRLRLTNFLTAIRSKAPVLHISFGVDPAPAFVQKLLTWLRTEIHPLVLLQIGLQPNIGAGCTIRGNSMFIDLSLRQHFSNQRMLLIDYLRGDPGGASVQASEAEVQVQAAQASQPSGGDV